MKNKLFEIAVVGYDYRFKTCAHDGVEAAGKIKCFLRKPDAECTVHSVRLNDYVRETEPCRTQVRER